MSINIDDLWRLLTESQLLTAEQCQQLNREFGQVKGAAQQSNARTLAAWLKAQDVISRYQEKILLAGRPGPFVYGEYRVFDRIKEGPLAGNFRAKHGPTNHPVILIFLTGTAIQAPRLWNQLAQHVTAYCEIVHPHVMRRYEIIDLTTFKFLVVEGLQGQPVDQVLAAAGTRLAPQEACRIARQAAIGLGQLHQCSHVRGDLRPATLWMEPGGNVKLPHNPTMAPTPLDLRSFDPSGRCLALADYLAPELLQTGKAPDVLTDVYALGCTLYTLLAGQVPFPGGDVSQKMNRHATEPIKSLDTTFGVPQPISQIVAYMMAKNPAVRYQTAVDVANALGDYVDRSVVTPLPSMAVPTLPAYEGAIMARRARQTAQVAALATPAAQAPIAGVASPLPSAGVQPQVAGQPAAAVQTGGQPAPTDAAGAAAGTAESPTKSGASGWFSLRNIFLAVGLAVILLAALTVATCSSCFPSSGPREIDLEGVDDEGGSPEPAADAGSGEPAGGSERPVPPERRAGAMRRKNRPRQPANEDRYA